MRECRRITGWGASSTTKLLLRMAVSRSPRLSVAEPVIAELDRTLLQRAVGNLVSNAVAHTPCGGAIILATTLGTGAEASTVRIEVSDTGARHSAGGVAESLRPFLSEWMHRARKNPAGLGWDWPSCRASCCCMAARWRSPARWGRALASRSAFRSRLQDDKNTISAASNGVAGAAARQSRV